MDYDKVIQEIDKRLPDRFRQKPVEEKIYDRMPFRYEINMDAYKNNGELLHREFMYINKHGNEAVRRSKGELYIPEMLYWINFCEEYTMLAPFVLHVCLTDFSTEIADRKLLPQKDYEMFLEKSGTVLNRRNYSLPSRRYLRTLPIYRGNGDKEYLRYIANGKRFKTEEEVAEAFVSIFCAVLNGYRLEYWHFSDEAYRYANELTKGSRAKSMLSIITGKFSTEH